MSRQGYSYRMQGFMKYCKDNDYVKTEENYESLLTLDIEQVTDLLLDYVDYLQERKISAVVNYLQSPELFFEMNRRLWHKKVVKKSITKDDRITAGKTPATDDDVFNMINANPILRNKLIIHYCASTGSRPGSIIDPPLQFKNLIPLPDITGFDKFDFDPDNNPEFDRNQFESKRYCYAIKIYDGSNEGYWSFLIPSASDIMDEYRHERKLTGENITDESYIFTTFSNAKQVKYEFVTNDNLAHIIQKSIKDGKVKRKLVFKGKYNKSQSIMFRKRFNTHLKLKNEVNSNIAEKLMAHKRGLDGTYLQPTLGELYIEFFKAISILEPDPRERHRLEIQKKQERITELEEKEEVIEEQKKQLDDGLDKVSQMAQQIKKLQERNQHEVEEKNIMAEKYREDMSIPVNDADLKEWSLDIPKLKKIINNEIMKNSKKEFKN